jgi:tetratricopeptide (TPR) repeat protein
MQTVRAAGIALALAILGTVARAQVEQAQVDPRIAAAHTLALGTHYQASIALYDSVLALDPKNWDAALARARVVAWSGQLADAEADYRSLMAAGAGPDAEKGLAQVVAWRGRRHESEALYRQVVARDSMDTEAWTGLAQVLQWDGRPRAAEVAIKRGMAAHPDDGDARAEWLAIRPLVSPAVRPSASSFGDSDHNTSVVTAVEADALLPWSGRVSFIGNFRDAWRSLAHGTSTSGRVGASWADAGERLTLQGAVGVAATNGHDVTSRSLTMFVGSAHAAVRLGSSAIVGAGVSADPFDETAALIAHGIRQSSAGADVSLLFHGEEGPHLDANSAYVGVGGGTREDERVEGSIYLWSASATHGWHGLSIGAGAHGYGYLRADSVDGYFTPASFILGEGVVRWATNVPAGWNASAEIGAGLQHIALFGQTASTKPAERVQASLSYRVAPGIDYGISGSYTVAASPVTPTAASASNYSGYGVAVFARVIP